MKKLLSITGAVSLVATSSFSLVSCSTTLLTNPYTINFRDTELINDLYNQIRYEWDDSKKEYVNQNTATVEESDKTAALKASLNGELEIGNSFFQDLMNMIFFNSNDLVVNNERQEIYQYLFSSDEEGIYVDGQSKTSISDRTKEEDVIQYYNDYQTSGKGIGSILGLYNYWEIKDKLDPIDPSQKTSIPSLGENEAEFKSKMKMIDDMFTTSSNQGITGVTFLQDSYFLDGSIALFDQNQLSYDTPWISQTKSNYSKDAGFGSSGKENYIAGAQGSSAYDPFAQLMFSTPKSISDLKNTNITLNEVSKDDFKESETPGEILKKDQNTTFDYYWTESEDGKKTGLTTNAHGYQMVELSPLKMDINYNSNLKLDRDGNSASDYLGDDYTISLEVSGLNAVLAPVVGYIQNDTNTILQDQIYIGWKLAGYQFNNSAVLGYDETGKALDSSSRDFSAKDVPFTKNKFDDIAITSFDIKQEEK